MSKNSEVLLRRTLDLWPIQVREILQSKGIDPVKLSRKLSEVIYPWDVNYDQQRMLFSTQIQERPLFIVKANKFKEVEKVINLIDRYKLSLRVLGGRHSPLPSNPQVFLDLSNLRRIRLSNKILQVQSGATQGEVNHYLFNKGFCLPTGHASHPSSMAFPGGSAVSVGVGGIILSGGIGTLRRTLGLAIDSVVGFTVVVPRDPSNRKRGVTKINKARIIEVSDTSNADLFWALRGGGPCLAVVLEIRFKVKLIPSVIPYSVSWKWNQASQVLKRWSESSIFLSSAFNEDLAIFNDSDSLMIELSGLYVMRRDQSYEEAHQSILTELEKLPRGRIKISSEKVYLDLYTNMARERAYYSYSVGKTILTDLELSNELIERMIEMINNWANQSHQWQGSGKARFYLGFQLMGGRISKVRNNETAFYPRRSKFFIDIFNFWSDISDTNGSYRWNKELFSLLYEELGPYTYVGFPIKNFPLEAYYGSNLDRLSEVSKTYDPNGILYQGSYLG